MKWPNPQLNFILLCDKTFLVMTSRLLKAQQIVEPRKDPKSSFEIIQQMAQLTQHAKSL